MSALGGKADVIVAKADIGPVAQSMRQPDWLLRPRQSDSGLRIDQKIVVFRSNKLGRDQIMILTVGMLGNV
jgi:hypothetical protein